MPVLLPEQLCARVAEFPESSYGATTMTVTMHDGRVFAGVVVAWGREVVRVPGHEAIPFTTDEIAAVDPSPK